MDFSPLGLKQLSLEQLVGQMTIVRTSGHLLDQQIQYPVWEATAADLQQLVRDGCIGGVIFLGGSAGELALRTAQIQSWATYPLLMAADIEEGVGQRFAGATWFPPPMALGAIYAQSPTQGRDLAQQMGAITAQEAVAVGLNWLLAPIVDVNNNPANPVINVRALGSNPETVTELAKSFIAGAAAYPVLTCAKHFPGHGDTTTDSHLVLPQIDHDLARLQQVEMPPFLAAIAAGVDSVMTAHLQIPALDSQYPATLSRQILTNLLRQQMGYGGLIVTDALMMGAIVANYGGAEAAVMAVAAGADLLMMPVDAPAAIAAVCRAVTAGTIPRAQIEASVARIWAAKAKLFGSFTPADPWRLAQTASAGTALAQEIDRLAAAKRGPLPLAATGGCNLIVVDEGLDCAFLGRTAPAVVCLRDRGYQCQMITKYAPVTTPLPDTPTVVQLFVRGNPFGGGLGIVERAKSICTQLERAQLLQGIVIYGSPYLFAEFAAAISLAVPMVFCYGQMPSAQVVALDILFENAAGQLDRVFTD